MDAAFKNSSKLCDEKLCDSSMLSSTERDLAILGSHLHHQFYENDVSNYPKVKVDSKKNEHYPIPLPVVSNMI